MKHHHLHAGYILILVLVLSIYGGCSNQSGATTGNYRYGTQALDMQWKSNQNKVYVGDDLSLLLQLRNRGTYDIKSGELFLSGYDPTYLDLEISSGQGAGSGFVFDIDGKDQFDPNGDRAEIFTIKSMSPVRGPRSFGQFPQTIVVSACYRYESLAITSVCIDPDPYNRKVSQKACTMSTVSVGGQGAPVVVSSVEPIMGRDSVRFNIRLSNSGNGVVYEDRSGYLCADGLKAEDTDKVRIYAKLGEIPLICSPGPLVWLNSGTATVMCECDNGCVDTTLPAYQTLLEVKLVYGYRNAISTQVTIINDE
jgi:hypothetical protein